MAVETYNTQPYYDDYDPNKGFVQILAVAGKPEQSREFTQMGTMYRDFMGRLGDAIFKDGAIIEGCSYIIDNGYITISPGRIYYGGLVRIVRDTVKVPITGSGTELIGMKIKSEIVTENQDASLRNPAIGTEAAGTAGAHRVKETLIFTNNDPDATTIFHIEDGGLVSDKVYEETTSDIITDVMARRTYDENGNFKIRGLQLADISDSNDYGPLVGLTEGKAYIQGYEVVKPYQTKINPPYSKEVNIVQNEPKVFITNQTVYPLNNYPVKQIDKMTVDMQVTIEMTRGPQQDGYDFLPHTPVIEIVSIDGYTQGRDYQLSADRVDWSVAGGTEPATGSTYQVTYKYKKNLEIGTEVKLETRTINGEVTSVVVFQSSAAKPINNTQMIVDYQYYLARRDLVLLDKNGEVTILQGIPAKAILAQTPVNQDSTKLVIGSIMSMPNSAEVYIVNQDTVRLTQLDMYNLRKRVDELEVSLAMTDLDREAMDGEDATDLKGIYTDGFVGLTKADVTNSEFNCSIDLDTNEVTLPFTTDIAELEINSSESNIQKLGRVIMAPFEQVAAMEQPYASEAMLINPYAVYNPVVPVKITPEVDNWIETSTIRVNKETVKYTTLRRWWYHRGESWAESEKAKWQSLGFADGGASLGWNSGTSVSASTSTSIILDEAVTYMRQRSVTIEGYNFNPNEDNIVCTFNGIKVSMTPASNGETYGYRGTISGTMKANAKGYFKATFRVPAGVPCGQVQVLVKGPVCSGETTYKAQGRKQVIQETVLTTKNVVTPTDPLAQSFGFDADTILTSIDLFFAAKDDAHSCIVQIRNMVNGYPGTECYTEEIIDKSSVVVSGDASRATNVKFSQPVYCQADVQYCVVILTDSNVTQLWVAELGARDVRTKQYITSNPYVEGVMFSSSNALTWTAHQTKDLKFKLYKARFTGKGQIVFNNVTNAQMNRVVLAASYIDYKNAGIEWWYRNASNEDWKAIDTYSEQDLTAKSSAFQLKATMNVAYSTSPIVASDCVNLVYFLEGNNAVYVSRMIETEETFTNIKVLLQLCLPSGCTARAYVKMEDVSNNWIELTNPDTSALSNEYTQYQWNKSGVSAKRYRFKLEMHTVNPLIRPRARKLINILKY